MKKLGFCSKLKLKLLSVFFRKETLAVSKKYNLKDAKAETREVHSA